MGRADHRSSLFSHVQATVPIFANAPLPCITSTGSNAPLLKQLLLNDVNPRVAVYAVAELPPLVSLLTHKQVLSTMMHWYEYDLFRQAYLEYPPKINCPSMVGVDYMEATKMIRAGRIEGIYEYVCAQTEDETIVYVNRDSDYERRWWVNGKAF